MFLSELNDLSLKQTMGNHLGQTRPRWFILLKEIVLINPIHSNRLKDQYCVQNFSPAGYKSSSLHDVNTLIDWVALWTLLIITIITYHTLDKLFLGNLTKSKNSRTRLFFNIFHRQTILMILDLHRKRITHSWNVMDALSILALQIYPNILVTWSNVAAL